MKNKKLKPIPKFDSEADEKEFWQNQDSAEYIDWDKAINNSNFY